MKRGPITRRTFLKGAGASAAGFFAMRLLGMESLAAGESAPPAGSASQESERFVYRPYWDGKNVKIALGGEILFFGDIHDMEDDFFFYDKASGETRGVFTYLANGEKRPGLYACIGDYLQESSDITQNADAYYKSIDRIHAWAGEDAAIVSVMGNHEFKTAAASGLTGEQVFEKTVGNNNYGLVARGVDPDDREKTLYYVVAFGCAHTQEIDEANTRATARNKYWVNPDQIAALDVTLAEIYGEDGSRNQGIPTFINAHLPVHYYTAERCAENSCDLLTILNKYPYVVYVWGHNHSEKDPNYGTVKLPGNTIVPNGSLDEMNSDGSPAAREITFTYVACGAVRGNQISDHALEDSERALYAGVEGSRISFEYCGRDGNVFDRTTYDDLKEMTHFEDSMAKRIPASFAAATCSCSARSSDRSREMSFPSLNATGRTFAGWMTAAIRSPALSHTGTRIRCGSGSCPIRRISPWRERMYTSSTCPPKSYRSPISNRRRYPCQKKAQPLMWSLRRRRSWRMLLCQPHPFWQRIGDISSPPIRSNTFSPGRVQTVLRRTACF